jgi:hypothetical protein
VIAVVATLMVLSRLAGYAYADYTIGQFTTTYNQGAGSLNPTAPTGVTFTSANTAFASQTNPVTTGSCTSADSSTPTSPDLLSISSTIVVCLNARATTGYLATDEISQVTLTWGTTAPTSTTYELAIYFGGATAAPVKAYVKTPSTLSASAPAMITFDLTAAGVIDVSSMSVIVSQCSGSTCP